MFLLAVIAAVTVPPEQAGTTVRIVRAQAAKKAEWERARRKREIVIQENGRKITVRLIEFE